MNPFTRATKSPYQESPESKPDNFNCPAKFRSVREALKHNPKRYLPWNKNGWKLELDACRESLHTFGEHPENPTLQTVSSILASYREKQRMATRKTNPADPIVKKHALSTHDNCTCMLCSAHARRALDTDLYLNFEKKLIIKTIRRIQNSESHLSSSPPPTSAYLEPRPHFIEETVSGDIPTLRRTWKKELEEAVFPEVNLHFLIEEYLQDYGIPPETVPPELDILESLLQEYHQEHGGDLLRNHLADIIGKEWRCPSHTIATQQTHPPGKDPSSQPKDTPGTGDPRPETSDVTK